MSDSLTNQSWPSNAGIIRKMEEVIEKDLGEGAWVALTQNKGPEYGMDDIELSSATSLLIANFDKKYDAGTANKVFSQIRHGLTRADFGWAREKFLQYGDIDSFAAAVRADSMADLKGYLSSGELFYGQPITPEVYEYLMAVSDLFYGVRDGNRVTATAIPFRAARYLKTHDDHLKRYYMCHCQFARESIKSRRPVSKTMCYCSLGHILMFWEAALDTTLEGDVATSALGGDADCKFIVYLPEDIIQKYTI